MNDSGANTIRWKSGLWHNNAALVQLLGLCPLLAVSNTAINGVALGLATLVTLVVSNTIVSATRHWLIYEVRIPVFVLLISGIVTTIGMLMNAFSYELYLQLGIFIPLIITNCTILARAEAFASRNAVAQSFLDGVSHGVGFALVLIVMGAIRELLGTGTLFSQSDLLFGTLIGEEPLMAFENYRGLLVAVLPPGAFIVLGLLIAGKNLLEQRKHPQHTESVSSEI